MKVEYSEDLRPTLEGSKDQLQIQSTFFSDTEIKDRYLNRGFGNAYNFDQENRLTEEI
jgi:hypothetical protein